jgi:transaldolase
MRREPNAELIWASPRELLNIFQADAIGCHIITVTDDILKKLPLVGKSLDEYSLETVKMFHDDARAAGFSLGAASTTSPGHSTDSHASRDTASASRRR